MKTASQIKYEAERVIVREGDIFKNSLVLDVENNILY